MQRSEGEGMQAQTNRIFPSPDEYLIKLFIPTLWLGRKEQKVLKLNVILQCWQSTVALVVWTERAVFFFSEVENGSVLCKKRKLLFFKPTAAVYVLHFKRLFSVNALQFCFILHNHSIINCCFLQQGRSWGKDSCVIGNCVLLHMYQEQLCAYSEEQD